jgi:arylsulfatase A-like enzyme
MFLAAIQIDGLLSNQAIDPVSATASTTQALGVHHLGCRSVLGLSAWCGIVAGLLEVVTIVVRKHTFDSSQLYGMSRHFLWVIPLVNLGVFLAIGVVLCLVDSIWPRRGSWIATRFLCALALLPSLLVAFPTIYSLAWLVITLGIAMNLVPPLERRAALFKRLARVSFLIVAAVVFLLAAVPWGTDRFKEWREQARPLPPDRSANVILIVLDTVAAGHMNLYGYERKTSPTMAELGERGVRFDSVQSASSWTLPSHASMLTGRWPHEHSAGWRTPLDRTHPTLAEFLSSQGYATAGFIANTLYCASDSGLGRGFTEYHDYVFPYLTALRMAVMVNRLQEGVELAVDLVDQNLDLPISDWYGKQISPLFVADRKDAETVNRQFLGWLSRRPPDRPFFAFLNYFDAHWPYRLPADRVHRFGVGPKTRRQKSLIHEWWSLEKRGVSQAELGFVYDSYDDCVASLDEDLGRLFDELDRRGALEQTWVIIVSDHGESFGEHAGIFCHGTSLYQTELHVPMVIIPPVGAETGSKRVVAERVSLRDLAATIVALVGFQADSPFPGQSLARFWDGTTAPKPATAESPRSAQALSEVVPNEATNPESSTSPKRNWPLSALVDQGWSYIRRDGDAREELFHLPDDGMQQRDRTLDPAARPTLERMRAALGGLTGGNLTPERFKP